MTLPPYTTTTTMFPQFSKLPAELRHKIWTFAQLTASSVTRDSLGPGLWFYQPKCWEPRAECELEDGYIVAYEPFNCEEHVEDDAECIWYATWLVTTNVMPPSPLPLVNKEARDCTLAAANVHKEFYKAKEQIPEEEEEEEEEDDDGDQDDEDDMRLWDRSRKQRAFKNYDATRLRFDCRKDALYLPAASLEGIDEELEEMKKYMDDEENYWFYTWFDKIAVTQNTLLTHLDKLGKVSKGFSRVKELLVIVGDEPDEELMGRGWYGFKGAGTAHFVWNYDGRNEDIRGLFDSCHEEEVDEPVDEFTGVIEGLVNDLRETLDFDCIDHRRRSHAQPFRIVPVVAVLKRWL